MIASLLIANRGEIAARIKRTCDRLGIRVVTVYSDADKNFDYVNEESVYLGPPPSGQSYLLGDKIIQAAKDKGVDAIHPGFGFLSENADFARKVTKNGLIFIGPNADAIDAMGDKITSKRIAEEAGVPTIPGTKEAISNIAEIRTIAKKIGYPVMVKASAGGGGKGMRIVHKPEELEEAFERAQSEAANAFGDDRVFIEKFIENPRHIEIQILADQHSNVIHLGERECSIQRRNQKIIEEAPSAAVSGDLRTRMAETAIALAKAVKYDSVGTVEYVLAPDGQFYFLEMNTRLQVEHPITEMVTGLDLVEEMIRVASNEPLRHKQQDIALRGHAIEARVYAEDCAKGFLPSTGRLKAYAQPQQKNVTAIEQIFDETITLRLEGALTEGDEISMYYDPMIAKVITHAETREAATRALATALDHYVIDGVITNLDFLNQILLSDAFFEAQTPTSFLDQYLSKTSPDIMPETIDRATWILTASVVNLLRTTLPDQASDAGSVQTHVKILCGEAEFETCTTLCDRKTDPHTGETTKTCIVSWLQPTEEGVQLKDQKEIMQACVQTTWYVGQPLCDLKIIHMTHRDELETTLMTGDEVTARVTQKTPSLWIIAREGWSGHFRIFPHHSASLLKWMPKTRDNLQSNEVTSPMPGLIKSVYVSEGQVITAGMPLMMIEAMKMENKIIAERDGKVKKICVVANDQVSAQDPLMVYAEEEKAS